MIILGIETSCDETAAAVLTNDDNRITILSNVVASSASLQSKYGGIIPEQAAREQIKSIIPVITEALQVAKVTSDKLSAIAVTYGPGLIGSLLVGVETAKTLSLVWGKPLIPINHLLGHFYANWISPSVILSKAKNLSRMRDPNKSGDPSLIVQDDNFKVPAFPCLGLLVSGGHTDLVLFTDHNKYKHLGGTRDDAAGECFDKCARLLGLPYPGGPQISKLAQKGDPTKFKLPVPMKGSKNFDFSYSGLKTAVANLVKTLPVIPSETRNLSRMRGNKRSETSSEILHFVQDDTIANLAAAIEETIVTSLVDKVILALKTFPVKEVMVAGGVAANQKLVKDLRDKIYDLRINTKLHVPPPNLCTDNAAMIASAAFFVGPIKNPLDLQADPNLTLS